MRVDGYIKHNGDNLWNFDVKPGCTYMNASHIHPLKQKDVQQFIDDIRGDEHIVGVIVFGSAVRFDCHSGSDIDLLVVRDDDEIRIDASLDDVESEMDLIFSSRLGDRLREEIGRTGVIVYRR